MEKGQRLISLDVMRGMTVAGMILVNNGAGPDTYAPLKHSVWNGLTPCDLVFPFFLFMVGLSIFISLRKYSFRPSKTVVVKILKRTLLLFVIGLLLHMWDMVTKGNWNLVSEVRVWGVLQRIALCYGIVSLLVLYVPTKRLTSIMFVLLAVYMLILIWGNGYEMSENNILAIVDRAIFGEAHLYHKSPVDPEGLVSTISAVIHTYIGFLSGKIVMETLSLNKKIKLLIFVGFGLLIATVFFLTGEFPINKRIWSPSFVSVTCGLAMIFLAILILVIDKWEKKKWCKIFQMFGMNAFFIYVLSEALAPALSHWGLKQPIYEGINSIITNTYLASLTYATLFVGLMACIAWVLWKKNIFIKI